MAGNREKQLTEGPSEWTKDREAEGTKDRNPNSTRSSLAVHVSVLIHGELSLSCFALNLRAQQQATRAAEQGEQAGAGLAAAPEVHCGAW